MHYQFLLVQAVLAIFCSICFGSIVVPLPCSSTFLRINLLIKLRLENQVLMLFHNILEEINHLILKINHLILEGIENTPFLKALKTISLSLGIFNETLKIFSFLFFADICWLSLLDILYFSLLIILVHY